MLLGKYPRSGAFWARRPTVDPVNVPLMFQLGQLEMENHMSRTTPHRFRVTVADIFWFEADTFGEAMAEARRWSAAVSVPATVQDCAGRVLGRLPALAYAAE